MVPKLKCKSIELMFFSYANKKKKLVFNPKKNSNEICWKISAECLFKVLQIGWITGQIVWISMWLVIIVSVLPSWKLSGVGILANKAQGQRAGGPRAEGFICQYSHSTQFPTG